MTQTAHKLLKSLRFSVALFLTIAIPGPSHADQRCEHLFYKASQSASVALSIPSRPSFHFRDAETSARSEERRRFVMEFNSEQNTKFPNIKAELDEAHRTVRFIHAQGRVLPGSRARFLLLHGNGASYSRGWTMTQILRSLAEPLPSSSSTVKALRRDPNYLQVSAESIDQLGCGEGPALPEFADASRGVEWLASYIRDMKKETPDLPVIVLTRSSSAALAVETAKKYPELVDALVLMSPSHPGDPAVFDGGLKVVMEELRQGLFEPNMPNLLWIAEILKQLRWDASTFNRPTYIMAGGKDAEVSDLERQHYSLYAETNPRVAYREFADAGHNILDTNKKETKDAALAAYADVLAFVKKVVNLRSLERH